MMLPEKLKDLSLLVADAEQASLAKRSVYSLAYADTARHAVGLSLPIADKVFQDGDLFAAFDMNLPEGYTQLIVVLPCGTVQDCNAICSVPN